jgi:hypothetical protein
VGVPATKNLAFGLHVGPRQVVLQPIPTWGFGVPMYVIPRDEIETINHDVQQLTICLVGGKAIRLDRYEGAAPA